MTYVAEEALANSSEEKEESLSFDDNGTEYEEERESTVFVRPLRNNDPTDPRQFYDFRPFPIGYRPCFV